MTKNLLALLLAALLIPASASAQRALTYSDHEPLGGMRTRFIKDVFFAAIEKESNGRLKGEDHWDSTVSTGYDALRKLSDGQLIDMAMVVPEYSAKELPLHQIFKGFPTGLFNIRILAVCGTGWGKIRAPYFVPLRCKV